MHFPSLSSLSIALTATQRHSLAPPPSPHTHKSENCTRDYSQLFYPSSTSFPRAIHPRSPLPRLSQRPSTFFLIFAYFPCLPPILVCVCNPFQFSLSLSLSPSLVSDHLFHLHHSSDNPPFHVFVLTHSLAPCAFCVLNPSARFIALLLLLHSFPRPNHNRFVCIHTPRRSFRIRLHPLTRLISPSTFFNSLFAPSRTHSIIRSQLRPYPPRASRCRLLFDQCQTESRRQFLLPTCFACPVLFLHICVLTATVHYLRCTRWK